MGWNNFAIAITNRTCGNVDKEPRIDCCTVALRHCHYSAHNASFRAGSAPEPVQCAKSQNDEFRFRVRRRRMHLQTRYSVIAEVSTSWFPTTAYRFRPKPAPKTSKMSATLPKSILKAGSSGTADTCMTKTDHMPHAFIVRQHFIRPSDFLEPILGALDLLLTSG